MNLAFQHGMFREISGDTGEWIVDMSGQAAPGTPRGTPYHGWRKGDPDTPSVWVVHHWIDAGDESWVHEQQSHREHLTRSFDLAQKPDILRNALFLQVLDRAAFSDHLDEFFLISELAESTLEIAIQDGGVGPRDIAEIRRNIAAALNVLHNALGIVHCDVAPNNIFSVGGDWKLGDLGGAVAIGDPIQSLPRNRRYVPNRFVFGCPAEPELDRACLSNLIAALESAKA